MEGQPCHGARPWWKRLSEAFDITKFTEILKKLKELQDQNPNITKEDLARSPSAEFNRTITTDNIDTGIEWLRDHNLAEEKPAELPPAAQSAQNEPPTGGNKELPATSREVTEKAPDTNKMPPDETRTPPVEGQDTPKPTELKIPKNIRPAPITEIDECIRNGYKRDDIVKIMKKLSVKGTVT